MLRTADSIGYVDPREEDPPMQTDVTAPVTDAEPSAGWILRCPVRRPVDLEPYQG